MQLILQAIADNLLMFTGIVGLTLFGVVRALKQPNPFLKYDELERLHQLLEKGVINAEDFEIKKIEILELLD